MSNTVPTTFTVPLSWEAHARAQQFQRQQANIQKAKQVYLNTLAVTAVDHYLRCLGFETDLSESNSQNPIALNFMDVADLSIQQLGKLECRPVLPEAQVLQLPPEVWEDRIGYLAVQFTQSLKQAEILGFTVNPASEILLTDLKSLAGFPDYLYQFRQTVVTTQLSPFSSPSLIELGKWFEGIVSTGWQTLEALLETHPKLVEVRGQGEQLQNAQLSQTSIRRAKLLDLGLQLGDQTVVLVLTLALTEDQSVNALVQVHPALGAAYLPAHLQLKMLSESGKVMQEVWSRSQDSYIQLKRFSGQGGDHFRLQVVLNDASITENFVF